MTEDKTKSPLIVPFRGIRFAQENLTPLVCPPYDIISPVEREALYRQDPHSIIRLEFSLPKAGLDNYQAAAQDWDEWRRTGVLVEDEPAYYVSRAEFTIDGKPYSRLGLFAALHLESLQDGRVLPHEATHAAAKADRLALMEACQANFSPIWTTFDNPALGEVLQQACAGEPVGRAETPDGSRYTLWRVADPATVAQIGQLMDDGPVIIADGHHRYETGLYFSQQHPQPGAAPVNYVLALMVEASDPGLIILPTHRVFTNLDAEQTARLWEVLQECCEIEQVDSLDNLLAQVDASERAVGFYSKEQGYLLVTLPQVNADPAVSIIHRNILEPALGAGIKFTYYKDAQATQAAVIAGEGNVALFVPPLRSHELIAAAQTRTRLPQKSTYFWPKIPTGLVMRSLESTS